MSETITAPRWDLSNVYPSLESDEFKAALQTFDDQMRALESFFEQQVADSDADAPVDQLASGFSD